MQTMVTVMSILGVLGLSSAAVAQSTAKGDGTQTTIKVSGMSCGACAKRVEGVVKKVAGVSGVEVSQPKGAATITFDPGKTSPEALVKTINEKTGFKAELVSTHQKPGGEPY